MGFTAKRIKPVLRQAIVSTCLTDVVNSQIYRVTHQLGRRQKRMRSGVIFGMELAIFARHPNLAQERCAPSHARHAACVEFGSPKQEKEKSRM